MNILGIGGSEHDFAASLIQNGKIVYSIEEERLNRVKYCLEKDLSITPLIKQHRAIEYCLQAAGIGEEDIDLIIGNDLLNKDYIPQNKKEVILLNHHLTHAASAFFTSPFKESAILVVDAIGSKVNPEQNIHETITSYYAENNDITEISKIKGKEIENPITNWTLYENSLGRFYYHVTSEIGFSFLEEGKTMGLAPYGNSTYVNDFYRFYSLEKDNFQQTHEQILEMIIFMRELLKDASDLKQAQADLAFAVQYHLEEIMISICIELYDKTKSKNLCLAGGVALNSVTNRKILECTPFERIYIQPASGDAGTSIGAALYGQHVMCEIPRTNIETLFSPYLGKEYDEKEIDSTLKSFHSEIKVERPDNYVQVVANLIADGNIVAWFNGRSEIGPRALGNRSILVDPRKSEMKDILNERVKHRESFRPFAPIVLEEYQGDYFEMNHPSYYMLLVPKVVEEKQSVIPAVTHVDGTGRVQTVSQALNPELHDLLTSFNALTGVPVLLNTSFNDNGEPIVETPGDGIQCFLGTDIDYLAIGGYVISKQKALVNSNSKQLHNSRD